MYLNSGKRRKIFLKSYGRCAYCGAKLIQDSETLDVYKENPCSTIDHVNAKAKGGTLGALNLVACCVQCNSDKSDLSVSDFKRKIFLRLDEYTRARLNITEPEDVQFYYERLRSSGVHEQINKLLDNV